MASTESAATGPEATTIIGRSTAAKAAATASRKDYKKWVESLYRYGLMIIAGLSILVVAYDLRNWLVSPSSSEQSATQAATTRPTPQQVHTEVIETEPVYLVRGEKKAVAGKADHCVRWPKILPILVQTQKEKGAELNDPIKSVDFEDGKHHSSIYTFSIDPERWAGASLDFKVRHVPYSHPESVVCRWQTRK